MKMTVKRLLSGALVLLGFGSCSDNSDDEDMRLEYGTPTANYQVKGKVTSDVGDPLEGIQVIVKDDYAYFNKGKDTHSYGSDTIYTDAKGEFVSHEANSHGIYKQKVFFNDVDGDANRGSFKSDSVEVEKMEKKLIEDGKGHWYKGKYELSTTVKLKKADK